ncbi:MAG: hypothetical protein ABIR93_06450 [Saprospiraceae bacterium]
MKSGKKKKARSLNDLYGSFISKKSAEEIIKDLKESRNFSRAVEAL